MICDDPNLLQVFAEVVGVSDVPGAPGGQRRWRSYYVGAPARHPSWGVERERAVRAAVRG